MKGTPSINNQDVPANDFTTEGRNLHSKESDRIAQCVPGFRDEDLGSVCCEIERRTECQDERAGIQCLEEGVP
jgi:hypothetical protein